ncbi:MAG: Type 1 glutamine amidotransferase-like domain-containing protein [Treponema sp.]|nr:Type 1 glutamine amidotransferase-like domain-containing protein [Treponema sp.]
MKKIILTANGLENQNIGNLFLDLANKKPEDIKAVFVPTAANNAGAIEVLPKCLHDLLDLGILDQNIHIYDLHYCMEYEELSVYNAIYFCGGSSQYLLNRINATGFHVPLKQFVENGGIYIGVSAGSIVAANNLPENLGYLNSTLSVHGNVGIETGAFNPYNYTEITLPDNRAIIITDDTYTVVE